MTTRRHRNNRSRTTARERAEAFMRDWWNTSNSVREKEIILAREFARHERAGVARHDRARLLTKDEQAIRILAKRRGKDGR